MAPLDCHFSKANIPLKTTSKPISRYRLNHLGLDLNLQGKQTANTIGLNLLESISCRFLINIYSFSSRSQRRKSKNANSFLAVYAIKPEGKSKMRHFQPQTKISSRFHAKKKKKSMLYFSVIVFSTLINENFIM